VASMRLLEATHTAELLREAGSDGMHIEQISEKVDVDATYAGKHISVLYPEYEMSIASSNSPCFPYIGDTSRSPRGFAK
jgi:hypothetical protein